LENFAITLGMRCRSLQFKTEEFTNDLSPGVPEKGDPAKAPRLCWGSVRGLSAFAAARIKPEFDWPRWKET
jgi:hypothetical protein